MKRSLLVVAALLALWITGCSSQKEAAFPTQGELNEIASAPPPTKLFDGLAAEVDTWDLTGPLVDTLETTTHTGSTAWDTRLAAFASKRPGLVLASEDMHCLAREVAAFSAAKKALPPEALRGFMASRCGATTRHFALRTLSTDAAKDVTDEKLAAEWQDDIDKMIADTVASGSQTAGIAFVRSESRAVLVVVSQERSVLVEKVSLLPTDTMVLKGEVLSPASSIEAIANQGPFGSAACKVRKDIKLPAFEITCAVLPTDTSARIAVAAFPPGRILGSTVLDVLVFPAGATLVSYERPKVDASGSLDGAGLVAALNVVRTEAALPQVALDPTESATAARLAPYYFGAVTGRVDALYADRIALGVRAGWQVNGLVQSGDFASIVAPGANSPAELIQAAIEAPFARAALLDAHVTRIATGAIEEVESRTAAAIFGTYVLADTSKADKEAAVVLEQIAKLRAAKGASAPVAIEEVSGHAARVGRLLDAGGTEPSDALQDFMQSSAQTLSRGVRGISFGASSTEKLVIPDELLTASDLRVGVAVGHYKPEGEPWAQLVVLVVIEAEDRRGQTALVREPSGVALGRWGPAKL